MAEKNNIITWTIVLKDGEFVAKLKNTGGLLREANGQFAKTTVSVEELGNATKKLGSDMVVSEKQIKSEIAALKQLQQTVQIGSEEYRRLGSAMTQLKGQQQGLKDGSIGLASSLKGVSQSSGAAAATTLELGRVISDMPYGIRGVSNNLSQVASQMAFMARGTDAVTGKVLGLGGAFKAIGAQIAGPLGFLLLIQGVIAAVDFFAGGMKKAETSVSDLDLQIKKLNESLWIQKQLLGDDSTEALENYFATIEQHIELLREQKELQDLDIKSKERIADIETELSKIKIRSNFLQENINANTSTSIRDAEELERLNKKKLELDKENIVIRGKLLRKNKEVEDSERSFTEGTKTTVVELKAVISYLEKNRDTLSQTSEEYAKAGVDIDNYKDILKGLKGELTEIEKLQRKLNNSLSDDKAEALKDISDAESEYLDSLLPKYDQEVLAINEKYFKLKESAIKYGQDTVLLEKARLKEIADIKPEGGGGRKGRNNLLKERLFELQSEIDSFNKREELALIRTNREKLEIEQRYQVEALELKAEEYIAKEELRRVDNDKNLAQGKITAKDHATNEALIVEETRKAGEELKKAKAELNEAQSNETDRFNEDDFNKRQEIEHKYRQKQLDNMVVFGDQTRQLKSELALLELEDEIERAEIRAELLPEGSTERLAAERAISTARMELGNAELEHEQMIADAKYRVQLEYVNNISSIGGILASIAGKNKALSIAALMVQKGAAIAGVVINAQKALGIATSNFAAVPAILPPGIPNPEYAAAAIDYAKSVATTKLQAGLSIAAILATTISSFSKPSGGGNASGGGSAPAQQGRTFDFNLVGSTGQNQLAQTIGGQVGQTIRAYVVGSEITNQQQFDSQIQGEATIG